MIQSVHQDEIMLKKTIHSALYAETAPPVEIADRLSASMPNIVLAGISYRATKIIADLDKCVNFTTLR